MVPRPPLQEDRREGQDEGGEAGWQAWHGGVSRRGWASLIVPPAAPPSSPRRPPNPPPDGQSRAQKRMQLQTPQHYALGAAAEAVADHPSPAGQLGVVLGVLRRR